MRQSAAASSQYRRAVVCSAAKPDESFHWLISIPPRRLKRLILAAARPTRRSPTRRSRLGLGVGLLRRKTGVASILLSLSLFKMARRDSVGTTASVAATVAAVPSRLVLFLAFMVPRVLVSLGPHSGESSPPMYGDFEAQRHWMEVTTSVPLRDWYRDAPGNNLTYWGLDYPPLSAYFARALGDLSRGIIPALVAPTSSWGYEELAGKIFMRASVIAADALVLLPAVALVTAEHKATLAVLVLSQPGLLIIDHGHFQYNGVGVRVHAPMRPCAYSAARSVTTSTTTFSPSARTRFGCRCCRRRSPTPFCCALHARF